MDENCHWFEDNIDFSDIGADILNSANIASVNLVEDEGKSFCFRLDIFLIISAHE